MSIQWLESYITDDKAYCLYIVPGEATVRAHAEQCEFPTNHISRIKPLSTRPSLKFKETAMQITWDRNTCCHAGVCVSSLPEVFKIQEGEFVITLCAAIEAEIIAVVAQCPSGALQVVIGDTP